MILDKIWKAIKAPFNKLASALSGSDPVAAMQYEYDRSIEQIREGREGGAQYRALVERVRRQVEDRKKHAAMLEAQVKTFLQANDRVSAARFALELKRAKEELAESGKQLDLHEQAYQNSLLKIKHAVQKLDEIKHKITGYDAELKLSRAEAEISALSSQFNFHVTGDFGQAERDLQDQIDHNRGRVRVAVDLSREGQEDIQHEQTMGEDALRQFEVEAGLAAPETAGLDREPRGTVAHHQPA